MLSRIYTKLLIIALVVSPVAAVAQDSFGEVDTFITDIAIFINDLLIPIVFALAFLVFVWGMVQYFIIGGGDDDAREKGRGLMLWGIIAFVVMVSIWGIVILFSEGLGLNEDELKNIPDTPLKARGSVDT